MSGNVGFKGLTGTYKRGNTMYTITDGKGRIMLNQTKLSLAIVLGVLMIKQQNQWLITLGKKRKNI